MATGIALLIDSLWVAGIAGMLASLSFAEWRRSWRARVGRSPTVAYAQDSARTENVVSISVTETLTSAIIYQERQLASITLLAFLFSLTLFSLGLLLAAWLPSPRPAVWRLVLPGILFALSITQTIAAVWKYFSARTAPAS